MSKQAKKVVFTIYWKKNVNDVILILFNNIYQVFWWIHHIKVTEGVEFCWKFCLLFTISK